MIRPSIELEKISSLYGYDSIISNFLSFLKRDRKEIFLYLEDPMLKKTSDIAEQHFSIQSWLFKHRFKTKEGLLKTSFWYHHFLSTGNSQCLKRIKTVKISIIGSGPEELGLRKLVSELNLVDHAIFKGRVSDT